MNASAFAYDIYIQAPRAQVWEALTTGEHTLHFWKRYVRSDWKRGSRVQFFYPDQSKLGHEGELVEVDAPNRLVMTFDPKAEGLAEAPSRVTYGLSDHDGGTKFTLIHVGFPPDSKVLPAISEAWPRILSSMKTYIERELR